MCTALSCEATARGKEVQVNEYYAKYQQKLRTPEDAVKVVRDRKSVV